ncbi:hypothetical protein AVEN_228402-1 [Araneus ventricosus]|uniref:Uncharacterized protein n=1 Tax=Araneus ventricosus TaxID=182803 RepID=A0A4Y2VC48_ARAVE|nr:hypothetical protein AVEN_228402-1 [Araneus ventricosus]
MKPSPYFKPDDLVGETSPIKSTKTNRSKRKCKLVPKKDGPYIHSPRNHLLSCSCDKPDVPTLGAAHHISSTPFQNVTYRTSIL